MAVTPPPDEIERLRPTWASVLRHESGHALVAALHDIPIKHLTIAYAKGGFFTTWYAVGGKLSNKDEKDEDPTAYALTGAAGIVAEAIHHHRVGGGSLAGCLKIARKRDHEVGQGRDTLGIKKHAGRLGVSVDDVFDMTLPLVQNHWGRIEALAAELDATKKVNARRIRKLVGV